MQSIRPLLTVELHVHDNRSFTIELMDTLSQMNYLVLLVEEVCGVRYDCRNLIALPQERSRELYTSHVLRVAAASERIFLVNRKNIVEHAFPIPCARRGPCCNSDENHCCRHNCVSKWITREMQNWEATNQNVNALAVKHRDPRLYTRLRWEDASTTMTQLPH